jgi:hypothetical protein
VTPGGYVVGHRRFGGSCCPCLPCGDVIGNRRFGGPCCPRQPCGDVVGYRRFGISCCPPPHLPCGDVGYRLFGGPCCSHLPCCDVVGYKRFGVHSCLHLQGEMKMEVTRSFRTVISYHITTWRHNPEHLDLNLHRRQSLRSQ